MSKYQAYPEYKDSGIEWVGDIPNEWYVKPTFSLFDSAVTKNIDGLETNVLSLSYGKIIKRDVEKNFGLLPESFNTYQIVDFGDIILRLTDLQNDKRSLRVGLAQERGIITSAYLKLATKNELDAKFAYRLLHSYDTTKVFYGMGGGLRQSMKFEDFRRLPILVPPIKEQIQIAAFLAHETAKIDTLIEKQQQLIELLKEKRQAVISHVVTKGISYEGQPDVPMKDSGVEWLGEVPEHWEVTRAKFVASIFVPQRNKPELNETQGISWATMDDMKNKYIEHTSNFVALDSAQKAGSKILKSGAVIASCVGNFGITSINKVDVIINQQLQAFQPHKIKAEFLQSIVSISKQYFELIGTAATLVYVNQEGFENLPVIVPPEEEQEEISSFISEQENKFKILIDKATNSINLMQERRTALISAAVTGKIDVRHFTLGNGVAPATSSDTNKAQQEVTA